MLVQFVGGVWFLPLYARVLTYGVTRTDSVPRTLHGEKTTVAIHFKYQAQYKSYNCKQCKNPRFVYCQAYGHRAAMFS